MPDQATRSGRWRAYRTAAVVASPPGGVQPVQPRNPCLHGRRALLAAFLTARGMPTAVLSVRREHVDTLSCRNLNASLPHPPRRATARYSEGPREVPRGPSCPGSQARPLAGWLAAGALRAGLHQACANLETAPRPRVVVEEGADLQAGA